MKISELIRWLEKYKAELGEVNVCLYSPSHDMACESIIFCMIKEGEYIPHCEDKICTGDYLYMK